MLHAPLGFQQGACAGRVMCRQHQHIIVILILTQEKVDPCRNAC